jgi:flavorubredoxin
MFPLVSGAVARIIPVDELRWLTFGHFEADECGSMNQWLAAAPHAQLPHGMVGVRPLDTLKGEHTRAGRTTAVARARAWTLMSHVKHNSRGYLSPRVPA